MGLQQIADMLNSKGAKTARGGEFTKQGVKYILGNSVYAGEYCRAGSGEIYKIPKIVSKQLFNKINAGEASNAKEQDSPHNMIFGFIFDPAFALNGR